MHELLPMGHDQAAMRWLGRITASKAPIEERMQEYSAELRPEPSPNCRSWNSATMHAMGHFSENLDAKGRHHFLRSLKWCTEGKVPQSAPLLMGRSWALRGDTFCSRSCSNLTPRSSGGFSERRPASGGSFGKTPDKLLITKRRFLFPA